MSDSLHKPPQNPPQQPTEKPMDARCPRKLSNLPDSWCALAVQRLKALRHAGRELSEEEEAKLPGCPYAVNHQLANYCFFNLVETYIPDNRGFSDMEVAHFLNVSMDTIKKAEKKAVQRMRDSSAIKEIIDIHDGDQIMEDSTDISQPDFSKE